MQLNHYPLVKTFVVENMSGRLKKYLGSASRGLSLSALVLLAGCVSASLEDAAPKQVPTPESPRRTGDDAASNAASEGNQIQQAASPRDAGAARDNSFVSQGALNNDVFPTFAQTPRAATVQLSDEDKKAMLEEMRAIRAANQATGKRAVAASRRSGSLDDVARTHATETKAEIEN